MLSVAAMLFVFAILFAAVGIVWLSRSLVSAAAMLSMFGDGVFVEVVGVVGSNVFCVRNHIICGRGVVWISGKER